MSNLGLDGLVSGMPTNSVISKLIQAEKRPIINLEKEKQALKQKKDAWRDVNSRLDKLANKLTDLKLSSTFNSNTTSSTNEDVATATAVNDAATDSYTLDIQRTAQAQRISGSVADDETQFKNLASFTSFGTANISINGQSIEVKDTDTLTTFKEKINESSDSVKASIVDNNLVLESEDAGAQNKIVLNDDQGFLKNLGVITDKTAADTKLYESGSSEIGYSGDITIGTATTADTTITINETDTLSTVATNITNNVASVSASVGTKDGQSYLKLTSDNGENLTFSSADGLVENLRLSHQTNEIQSSQDAKVDINGITVTSASNEIDNAVDGVTFNLKSDAQAGDQTTIEVSKDTEKAVSAVQTFVDQYNSLQSFINKKLDYDEETKKAGTLQGDSTLMRLQYNLRNDLTDPVDTDSQYSTLSSIGISFGSVDGAYSDAEKQGQLSFDKTKFKEAIENDPQAVEKLFTANSKAADNVLTSDSVADINADLGYTGSFKITATDSDGNESSGTVDVGGTSGNDSLSEIKTAINNLGLTGDVTADINSENQLEIVSNNDYTLDIDNVSGDNIVGGLDIEKKADEFDGIARRTDGYLDNLLRTNTGVIPNKEDYYDNRMEDIDEEIGSLQDRLERKKQRLQEQFTHMEKVMAEMQSQQSWLQSQLGSMGSASSMLSSMM